MHGMHATPGMHVCPPGRHTPRGQTPPPRADTTPQDGYCSRRYASYWNALLFNSKLVLSEN